jgi:GTP-binding protein
MSKPYVCIVGRPNVGKSTLFNQITGQRISIVEDTPGVTRDRIFAPANWQNHNFILIDTGGIDSKDNEDEIAKQMRLQAQIAIDMADVVIFMVDIKSGLLDLDKEIAQMLRKSKKNVIVCVNKVDNYLKHQNETYEFYELGFDKVFSVSSINKQGIGDLLDEVCSYFSDIEDDEDEEEIKIAIIGKPNAGKSSLVNRILGENRVIVSNVSGTTRDSIDTHLTINGRKFNFIDTAGIRRPSRIEPGIEKYSYLRTVSSIERADICIIMIDATCDITEGDAKIAGLAHEAKKGVILAVNKWDAVEKDDKTIYKFRDKIKEKFAYMEYANIVFISALTGQRVDNIFELINQTFENMNLRISTGTLNEIILKATAMQQPPQDKGKRLKIFYANQVSVKPPTFVFFVNDETLFHFSYRRYLENQLRENFDFSGTPISLIARNKKDGE